MERLAPSGQSQAGTDETPFSPRNSARTLFVELRGGTSRRFPHHSTGGGGAMFHPTISPLDTDTALIACDMTGSYITHDGEKTWRMFNLRGVVDFFVFDPHDAKTMYAHATALWQSTDAGEHWDLVYPSPASIKGVKMNSDHSDETIPRRSGSIRSYLCDGDRSGKFEDLLCGGSNNQIPALFVSRDAGKTWQKHADVPIVLVTSGWIRIRRTIRAPFLWRARTTFRLLARRESKLCRCRRLRTKLLLASVPDRSPPCTPRLKKEHSFPPMAARAGRKQNCPAQEPRCAQSPPACSIPT